MAIHTADDRTASVGGNDLSDHLVDLEVTRSRSSIETTTQASANKTQRGGKPDFTVTCMFQQDYAASSVHASLDAAFEANTTTCIFKDNSSANVTYTGPFNLLEYTPVPGGTGDDLALVEAVFVPAGTIVIT